MNTGKSTLWAEVIIWVQANTAVGLLKKYLYITEKAAGIKLAAFVFYSNFVRINLFTSLMNTQSDIFDRGICFIRKAYDKTDTFLNKDSKVKRIIFSH